MLSKKYVVTCKNSTFVTLFLHFCVSFLKLVNLTCTLEKKRLTEPLKKFCRKVNTSKCIQSLKKRIKNSAELFEDCEFYPIAEPFLSPAEQNRFRRNLFCSAKLRKRFCKERFCLRVKLGTFQGFYRIVYPFLRF